jgi:2,3-bisphosphoglycerate-independent phosphoglycerate mutase
VLALFEQKAMQVLAQHPLNRERQKEGLPAANAILTRGAGQVHRLVPLECGGLPLRLACVSGDRTVLGLASWLGADLISKPEMTANLDTDLESKFAAAKMALSRHDLVLLHVKGADIASHDQRPELKVEFLERFDAALGGFLVTAPAELRIAIASDHATLSESGQHAADPLPITIWGKGISADEAKAYDETSVAMGQLQQFPLQMLLGRLFDFA